MSIITDKMYSFSINDLKNYLGKEVIETLVEWMPEGSGLLNKQRLISMIMSVHGVGILKNRQFRKDLLYQSTKEELYSLRDNYLSGDDKKKKDLNELIDIISNKPWANNKLSLALLNIWGIGENIFQKNSIENATKELLSNQERFYELLDYQFFIKQRAMSILNSNSQLERMLIHMPTGTGKTKTTMHIVADYMNFTLEKKGLIIWVAHTNELLEQACNTFKDVWSHLGDGDINIYRVWGNNKLDVTSELNGVAFCGLAKLMSIYDSDKETFDRLCKDCRLIVFDEAHKAAADKTKRVIDKIMRKPSGFENRFLIGLSATPGRTTINSRDNTVLSDMFGNRLISIDSEIITQMNKGRLGTLNTASTDNIIRYFQSRRILAKMIPEKLEYNAEFTDSELKILKESMENLGINQQDYSDKQLEIFAINKNRNIAIMKKLRELYTNNTPTIVFACSVKHAQMISAMLTLENIPNALVLGEMNSYDRVKAIENFKDKNNVINIIINYEVLTTGFDAKNIRCVFITRPTKSIVLYSQMLGRGLRGPRMGGNESCLLIDIDDNLGEFNNEEAFSHFNDYWSNGGN